MPEQGEKACTKCGVSRPMDHFNRSGRYRRSECRDSTRASSRLYGTENRARRNERLRAWRKENPEAARAKDRRAHLRAQYRLSEEDVEVLRARFDGACWLCRVRPAAVIDHDHATGRVRGVCCHGCNSVVLSRADADPGFLDRVRSYLDQPCHADVLLEIANAPTNGEHQ